MDERTKWAAALCLFCAWSIPFAAAQSVTSAPGANEPHSDQAASVMMRGIGTGKSSQRTAIRDTVFQIRDTVFHWPDGKKAALSLSFDDARTSQIDVGMPLFDRHDVRATFFVVPSAVEQRLDGWRHARRAGHEIGNHSLNHPCSGNFPWARHKALEEYSLDRMREELVAANRRIRELLDVTPVVFAYPCGQTFVGRGVGTASYVPIVAETFLAGRGWLDEAANDPEFVDLARVMGIEMDGFEYADLLPVLEEAKNLGHWVVLAGHEIGESGHQTTRVDTLEELIRYATDPTSEIWLAPVGTVAAYVIENRNVVR